jgi:hypothetical protein
LSTQARLRSRAKANHKVKPHAATAGKKRHAKKGVTAQQHAATTAAVRDVNASGARALSAVARADTHDRAMPHNVRLGLIALAALALLAVLLVPRAPAMLFARGLDDDGYKRRSRRRRAGVATSPAGGTRRT